MKNLLFSLIYLSLFFPCFVFAQSETEDILNFINSPQTETSTQENDNSEQLIDAFSPQQQTTAPFSNLSPEDQEFMRQRPGESPNAYTLRIRVENLRRSAGLSEGPQLPNPTTSTTQIPENNTLRPPLETLPPMRTFQQQSSPRTTTSGTILDQIVPMGTAGGGNALNTILNQLFWAGLVIAVILAVVMIITGGIQYMTTDAMSGKEGGKDRIKAALGGLILAFSTIVILNTININLTEITLSFPKLNEDGPNIRIGGIDRLGVDLGERTSDLGVRNSYQDSNGNYILERADGSRIISTPEGNTFTQLPDGTIVPGVSSGPSNLQTGALMAQITQVSNPTAPAALATGHINLNGVNYSFRSGGYGGGYLPRGTYIISNPRRRSENSFSVGGYGYSFDVSDKYDPRIGRTRTLLRIHPDGGSAGTLGCIGIIGNSGVQESFYSNLVALISANGGSYTLVVN